MANTQIDDRLTAVEDERQNAISENTKLYEDMATKSEKYYQDQIDASKEWAATQKENQQAQTDFAIEKIEQQKEQAQKDYTKEQSGAYTDWQKESNRYGANAEELAASGLTNTGYGESSQVRMYNTYQNRVAVARQSFELAKQNYDNAITDARLQNNSVLAEIAYNAYQQQLELSLQGFQYKNQLLTESANKKLEINRNYDSKYQDVLNQINEENRLAEEVRQFNAEQAWLKEKAEIESALERERLALQYGDNEEDTETDSEKTAEELAGAEEFKNSISGKYLVSPTALKAAELKEMKVEQEGADAFRNSVTNNLLSHNTKTSKAESANNVNTKKETNTSKRTHSGGSSTMGGTPRVTTYDQATAYMKQQGAISSGNGGLMTKSEWQRAKNAGGYTAATSYPTYESYLTNYVQFKVNHSK